MNKKKITVVSLDPRAGESYGGEIQSLFGDYAHISVYNVQDGSATGVLPKADLFVVSTDAYGSAEEVARHVPMGCQTMAIEVSFRWSELRKLKEIPDRTKVLFVNLTQTMAREAITQLNQFGINHIQLIPFYPGAVLEEDVSIAVTPDEMRYVPDEIQTKINLGQRPCTSGMMIEIALRLELEYLLETKPFQEYFRSIATSNYSFDQMFAKSIRLESQFYILMEILEEGIIGVNECGEIFACSHHAEEITRVSSPLIMGKSGEKVFPYIDFSKCLKEKERIEAHVKKINGVNISIEVVPVLRQDACVGAFAILQRFNDVEMRQNELRKQLLHKGHYAKYDFHDIIGNSQAILRAKEILRKMAASESPVLLIGETGTGKELFAHALHQASRRKKEPFVAVNVAAFPENLLESELFGYEEGAFTGAKKGGRPGLLEFAHKGTLFLDEVEGMSPLLQIKLLRVLQERELMRVGGNRIISIDVRIVAATNESLEQKVEEGSFRRDLYYRLNTLPIMIPPLAERSDDIFLLIDHFKKELGARFELTEPIRKFLKEYSWPGNIRELRNVVEYFIYTGHEQITLEDLPPTLSNHRGAKKESDCLPSREDSYENIFWFVLEQLYRASQSGNYLGREKILAKARECYLPTSQQEIRAVLAEMSENGLVRVCRGRGGSRLTPKGRQLWETR
ncbi:MAG: sigma 54-interacting transcriptional regulator [Hungatella sp.]|nr:sigma 54-interacting transcriptional regulator [Hungatella sp.]